ncbi:flavin reductase family protein [Mesorhizobium sp. SB112]|uniref:flavin reductase family protein n=1 Tax=Mesorhizobium sp. SB112 TaxID=3151853 RepID=UPI003264A7DF
MTKAAIDPRALRDAFGAFPTGVTVVTTRDGEGSPVGFTANSFTSVSLDPPLLLVCLAKTSRNFATMTEAPRFAINILSETQKDVSNTFARPVEDRFAAVDWSDAPDGSPVFSKVAAWFECSMEEVIEAGDHVILLGRVEAFANAGLNGLGYARGGYFIPTLTGKAVSAAAEGNIELGAVLERQGEVFLVGDDKLSLPACQIEDGNPTEALQKYLQDLTGLPVAVGFLYSVYEGKGDGLQHIIYRAVAGDGEPRSGHFMKPEDVPASKLTTSATADILNRFGLESSIGNFGVYFGDDMSGKVHSISTRGAAL